MTFKLLKQAVIGADVPMTVFDNLYSAKENDLKVILYALKSGEINVSEISEKLDISVASVTSSLFFWADKGLIFCEDDKNEKPVKKKISAQDILVLSKQRPEIEELVKNIQEIYGHVLNEKGTVAFLTLYIEHGIPVTVILLLAMYYAPLQKGPAYTARVILSLFEKDQINTMEKAEEHIKIVSERETRYEKVCELFSLAVGKLTKSEKTIIDRWGEDYCMSYEMIAFSKDVAGINRSIRYCNGILKSWSQKGYKQPSDVDEVHNVTAGTGREIPDGEDFLLNGMHIVPEYKKEG